MAGVIDNERFRKLLLAYPVKAIALLYDLYRRNLVHISQSLTHDENAAEDIVQDTFVHVWENHKRLGEHHETPIEHYLVRVVKYKSISSYKRAIRLKDDKIQFRNGYHSGTRENPVETSIIELEMIREIRQVIATFPARERECLLMRTEEDMTTEQIAENLKVSKKAVQRSVTSASKRLRKYFLSKNKADIG